MERGEEASYSRALVFIEVFVRWSSLDPSAASSDLSSGSKGSKRSKGMRNAILLASPCSASLLYLCKRAVLFLA